jgi:hypothetical protein
LDDQAHAKSDHLGTRAPRVSIATPRRNVSEKFAMRGRHRQHARRVRSPEFLTTRAFVRVVKLTGRFFADVLPLSNAGSQTKSTQNILFVRRENFLFQFLPGNIGVFQSVAGYGANDP